MTIAGSAWDEAVEVLHDAPEVALACHVGPDGDALGSMLALTIALRRAGKTTIASWGSEPFEAPRGYPFLPALDLLSPPSAVPSAPPLMITFDAGSFERLGSLEANARASQCLIVVDHHPTNDRFGTINLIDNEAAASAVLVYELLDRLGYEIDADIATCLYTGLVTDTGRFQYSNTTPHVHRIAADLIARGAPHKDITEIVYNTYPLGYLKVAGVALERIAIHQRGDLAWSWVTTADLQAAGVGLDEIEALIDLVRTVEGTDVAVVLKQQTDGRFRVSMRSRGANDVAAIAEAFGGGGHTLAAGYTAVERDPHAIIEQIAAKLPPR